MPDLSEMLGDVYGEPEEPAPAPATGPSTPSWSDDERLDRAFAEWTPGPDADAPAAERGMFAPAQTAPDGRLADDLAAALSEAVLADTDSEDVNPDDAQVEAVVATTAPTEAPELDRVSPVTLAQLEPELEPASIPMPVHRAGWQRNDDDILPTGRTAKGGVRLPKPSRAGKAPKATKGDSAPARKRRSLKDLAKMEIGGKKKK